MSVAPDEIFDAELEARRQAERAMRLLSRPGAVIEARGPGYGVRLGATIQDLGGTSVEHDNGLSEKLFPTHYRFGLAYKPIEGLTLAADVDDMFHLGAEYWVRGLLALRAGVQSERDTPESFGDALIADMEGEE